ncbi:MAG: hypothetical protein JJT75_13645 [Opitutales bacterium]|nr:hypothetical protein [Opitutales bacterium]
MPIEPSHLIHRIETLLNNPKAFKNGESLAREFTNRWDTACQRLEDCDRLREYGDDYTAVQIAETPPPLLDELDTLTFGELENWKNLCEEKGWPFPIYEYDPTAIEKLQELYAKPLNADHELYRELQGAILKKEFPKALPVLRELHHNYPEDDSLEQQRKVFEKKTLEIYEKEIQGLLTREENDLAIDRWLEIQEEEWIVSFEGDVFARITELAEERAQQQREEAGQELYYQLSQFYAAKEWEEAYQCLSDLQEGLAKGTHYLNSKRATHLEKMSDTIKRHQRIRELTEQAENQIEGIALLPPSQYKTMAGRQEVQDFCLALEEMEEEMASLEGFLPGKLEKRKKEVLEEVETLLQRYQQRLRIIQIAAGAAAVILLSFLLINVFSLLRERRALENFDQRMAQADALQLQSFMEDSVPSRIRFYDDAFEERKRQAEEIIRPQMAALDRVQRNRSFIESLSSSEYADQFNEIGNRLSIIEENLNSIPSSEFENQRRFVQTMHDRLLAESNRREAAINSQARDFLSELRQLALNPYRLDDPAELEEQLNTFNRINDDWQEMVEGKPRFIELREAFQENFATAQNLWLNVQDQFLEYRNHEQNLSRPTNEEGYRQLLTELAFLDLSLPLVTSAGETLRAWEENPDPLVGLFPDFTTSPIEELSAQTTEFTPNSLERDERRAYQTILRDFESENLENLRLHEGFRRDARGNLETFPIFVYGEVSISSFAVGREIEEFTFQQFLGSGNLQDVTFRRTRRITPDGQRLPWEGEWLDEEARSVPELQVLQNLQNIFDAPGNTIERPLLRELQRIYLNEDLDPRFKLFIDYHFYRVFRHRPWHWGIAFSQNYRTHRLNFERVLGNHTPTIYDFLSPEDSDPVRSRQVRSLYENPPEILDEARVVFQLHRQFASISTELAGIVDAQNNLLFHRDVPRSPVFVFGQSSRDWDILDPRNNPATEALPLSPAIVPSRSFSQLIRETASEQDTTVEFVRQQWQNRAPLPE